jgi:hypothetical protein
MRTIEILKINSSNFKSHCKLQKYSCVFKATDTASSCLDVADKANFLSNSMVARDNVGFNWLNFKVT